jgi:CheY-like chemotaxis protein
MKMPPETQYCICCGEETPTNMITRHGRVELTCTYCGFLLSTVNDKKGTSPDQETEPVAEAAEAEEVPRKPDPAPPQPEARPSRAPEAVPRKKAAGKIPSKASAPQHRAPESECIIISDDAELTRGLLNATLINRKLTQTVISTVNGQEFIKVFSKRLTDHQPVNLVILDLEMPVMNGIMAARVMRTIEQKVAVKAVPILFFSARKCDEELRKQLSIFSPAIYVNKGSETDPAKLMSRIDRLVEYLLEKRGTLTS